MRRVIDLDAARAARAETQRDAPVLHYANRDWTLPAELPFAFAEAAGGDTKDVVRALSALMGDQWDDFIRSGITLADIEVLVEGIPEVYGIGDPGK
jgi:hypothetical protein